MMHGSYMVCGLDVLTLYTQRDLSELSLIDLTVTQR